MKRRSELRHILDSMWVSKWKAVEGYRIIKSRLSVRGFKDAQQYGMSSFAGTATGGLRSSSCRSPRSIHGIPQTLMLAQHS